MTKIWLKCPNSGRFTHWKTCRQFHQHFTQNFSYKSSFKAKLQAENSCSKDLRKKCARKMLMKLTAVVNFINVQQAAFACTDPKVHKKLTIWLSFCAFGICGRKSCSYNVEEIDPWCKKMQSFFCTKTFSFFSIFLFFPEYDDSLQFPVSCPMVYIKKAHANLWNWHL